MGLGAVIFVPSFIKIDSGIQKLIGGHTDTQTASLLLFFQNKERRLTSGLISLLLFYQVRNVG
jgi:hypothetical protein